VDSVGEQYVVIVEHERTGSDREVCQCEERLGPVLRRNVRALCRNSGGSVGGCCVFGRHIRLISFCGITAVTTWITPVRPESKWILLDFGEGDGMAMSLRQRSYRGRVGGTHGDTAAGRKAGESDRGGPTAALSAVLFWPPARAIMNDYYGR
jgi:hypothetical protein